jgi:hypothetical protein
MASLYRGKLLSDKWNTLRTTGLAGQQVRSNGMPVTEATGLTRLSILSDCCAGQRLARITDHGAPYAVLTGLLSEKPGADAEGQSRMENLAGLTQEIDCFRRVRREIA